MFISLLNTENIFFLNGRVLPNNSIGEGSGALYCLTDCRSTEAGGELGVWRSPDGSYVSGSTVADIYLVRGQVLPPQQKDSGANWGLHMFNT